MTEASKACIGLAVLVAVWGSLGGAAPAAAGEGASDERERQALREARQHMERGQELYLQERFAEAAAAFERAFEAQPHSAFLYNAGVALERAGKPGEAAERLARYLAGDPAAPDAASVRQRIERLRTEALESADDPAPDEPARDGAGPPTTPDPAPDPAPASDSDSDSASAPASDPSSGAAARTAPPEPTPADDSLEMKSLVRVEADPSSARVSLRAGGEELASGGAPFTQTLAPGDYHVVIEHPDYQSIERDVAVRQGVVYMLIADLRQGQFLGYLTVVSDPPGAQVYLDDRAQGSFGTTPYQASLPTGSHRVWVERPGYEAAERIAEVGEGEQVALRVELERLSHGRLRIVTNVPEARVWIDDRLAGSVPFEEDVPAGTHRVRVEADGVKDWEQDVEVARGQLTPADVRLKEAPSRGGAWATAVLGAVFIGGGVALGLVANGIEDDLERDRDLGRLASDDDRGFKGRVMSIAGDTSLALGGLMALLSIYYFVRDPLPDSEATVLEPRDWTLVPAVGPDGAAAGLRWSF